MKRTTPLGIVALAVAMLALVASMGGASYAAKMITGKDIKNGSITAKDVKSKSLTGKQVKDKSLTGGDVKDGSIGTADLKAGLLEPDLKRLRVAATPGASFDAARVAAPEQLLFTAGPLTVYAKCFTNTAGPTTYAYAYVKTSQNGALLGSDNDVLEGGAVADFLNTDTAEVDRELSYTSAGANDADLYGSHSVDLTAFAADGTVISGFVPVAAKNGTLPGGDGIYGAGDACLFGANLRSNK